MAGAIFSVAFIDWEKEPQTQPQPIRPLKTMVIESFEEIPGRRYPGKVQAVQQVNLSFEVAGTIIELPVNDGDQVEQGQLLAKLDPRDYQNNLDAAIAERQRSETQLERVTRAAQSGAVSQQDLTDAQAAFDVADARVNVMQKALEDTELYASFSGVIANTFVENHQSVQAKQAILSLQDVSAVDIEVNVPEERIALSSRTKGMFGYRAVFDYLPDREFDVELKEYATEADPLTQTFAVTFTMIAPEDLSILPGMTSTIVPYRLLDQAGEPVIAVPLDVVPVDGQGTYYVWQVSQVDQDLYAVHRTNVQVGEMIGDTILITSGLAQGDRIAAAGVHFLQEGQQVRLLDSDLEAQ